VSVATRRIAYHSSLQRGASIVSAVLVYNFCAPGHLKLNLPVMSSPTHLCRHQVRNIAVSLPSPYLSAFLYRFTLSIAFFPAVILQIRATLCVVVSRDTEEVEPVNLQGEQGKFARTDELHVCPNCANFKHKTRTFSVHYLQIFQSGMVVFINVSRRWQQEIEFKFLLQCLPLPGKFKAHM
jgi:hypothetical protein